MNQKKKKGSKGSAAGRNRVKCDRYMSYDHQSKVVERKLRRILKSSGPLVARDWASVHGVMHILRGIGRTGGKIGTLALVACSSD